MTSQTILQRAPDVAEAASRLADLGFLIRPDLPNQPGPAWLLVAIRPRPTLRHFDPELVELWVHDDGAGQRIEITRGTRTPIDRDFSWGTIRIVDRYGIANEYVTFGGHLSVDRVGEATVAVLSSPAPLLRRGGHSQPADVASFDLSAFFARLMVAVTCGPGFEAALGAASPLARYAAFVGDFVARYRLSEQLQASRPRTWRLLRAERTRLLEEEPAAWREGQELRRRAGLH